MVKYALQEFKSIFGSVGEEVLDQNLLQNEQEILQETDEVLLHRKIFFNDEHNQVIIISIYTTEEGYKLTIHEPEKDKMHSFIIAFDQCFSNREIAHLNLDSVEVLKKVSFESPLWKFMQTYFNARFYIFL